MKKKKNIIDKSIDNMMDDTVSSMKEQEIREKRRKLQEELDKIDDAENKEEEEELNKKYKDKYFKTDVFKSKFYYFVKEITISKYNNYILCDLIILSDTSAAFEKDREFDMNEFNIITQTSKKSTKKEFLAAGTKAVETIKKLIKKL